jgi:NADH-quinone oxidoreductase subunit N
MVDAASFLAIQPEFVLTGAGLILLMIAAFGGDRLTPVISWLSVAALAVAGICLTLPGVVAHGTVFGGLYSGDAFAAYAKALIFAAAAASIIVAPRFFATDGNARAEYPILILFACIGMSIMVSASDFLTLYVGLELNSLAAYVLASFMRKDERSAEAGLKYFVLGGLASGILLYGISLLYGFAGTTAFAGGHGCRGWPRQGGNVRSRVRSRGSRLQDECRALPYVDARCL